MEIIITTPEKLKALIKEVLTELEEEKKKKEIPKLYSVNAVAKKLGKAHATIKKHVEQGVIRTTVSGEIPEDAINEYLDRS